MGIGAPKAKAVDADTARCSFGQIRPGQRSCRHAEMAIKRLDLWVEFFKMKVCRDLTVLNRQRCFDDTSETSTALGMTDNGLDRANEKLIVSLSFIAWEKDTLNGLRLKS